MSKELPTLLSPLFQIPNWTTTQTTNHASLSIHHNNFHNHTYTPGEQIVGVVTLTTFSPITNPHITVTFSGKLKTSIVTKEKTRKHQQSLFHFSKIIYKSPDPLATGTHAWDFSFNFPSHHELPPPNILLTDEDFAKEETYAPLPPSILFTGAAASASIKYTLKASLENTALLLKAKTRLNFSPSHSIRVAPSITKGTTIEKPYRVDVSGKAVHIGGGVLDVFRSRKKSEEKVFKCVIAVGYPTMLVLEQPYSIVTRLMVDEKVLEEEKVLPEYRYKSVEARVKIETSIRVPSEEGEETCVTRTTLEVVKDESKEGKLVVFNEDIRFRPVFHHGFSVYAPSFACKWVARRYEVAVLLRLECMGREELYISKPGFEGEMEFLPTVYLNLRKEVDGLYDGDVLVKRSGYVEEREESPPAYMEKGKWSEGEDWKEMKEDVVL